MSNGGASKVLGGCAGPSVADTSHVQSSNLLLLLSYFKLQKKSSGGRYFFQMPPKASFKKR